MLRSFSYGLLAYAASAVVFVLFSVFFVRSFTGDRKRLEKREFGPGSPSFGQSVRVTFLDGEVILGRSMNYRPEDRGFFLKPADPSSNNEMVFVPQSSLRDVAVGDAGEARPD